MWDVFVHCTLSCHIPYVIMFVYLCVRPPACVCTRSSFCDFFHSLLESRYLPVLLSLFLLVSSSYSLFDPSWCLIFFPFYLKSLHYHCTLPSKNTIQISPLRSTGRLVSLLFTLLKPRPWQTGAVLRPHLARRLRPVPASLFETPIPQCNLLIPFAPHSPSPADMLPCTTCQIVSCSLCL